MAPPAPDDFVRFRPGDPRGRLESFWMKASEPEGGGHAFWLRFTIRAPRGRPSATVAEVWATVFNRPRGRHLTGKDTFPITAADLGAPEGGLRFLLPGCGLERAQGGGARTQGRITAGGTVIAWDLALDRGAPPCRMFPADALYETEPFPRMKFLTPHPDSRFSGVVRIGDEEWRVDRWPGMMGHTWGGGHALRYAWAHANTFRGATPAAGSGTVFEGFSAKLAVGPFATPWITLLHLRHLGRDYDFRGLRHWLNRSVRVGEADWSFRAESEDAVLEGRLDAPAADFVRLGYLDPDGHESTCSNCSIARARLTLRERVGRGWAPEVVLETEDAALELLAPS